MRHSSSSATLPTPGANSVVYKIAGGIGVFFFGFWSTLFLLDERADKQTADPDVCPAGDKIALTVARILDGRFRRPIVRDRRR
jgi:hypothetical protein